MSNQIENYMNLLSGACAATIIDGIYSFCENKETIKDLYAVLHTLYEKELYSAAFPILCVFLNVIPIPDCKSLPRLTADKTPVFIRNFVEDFFEILREYKGAQRSYLCIFMRLTAFTSI